MAFSVQTDLNGSFIVTRSLEETMRFLVDYETSMGKHFYGLESFTPEGPNTYRWKFKKLSYGGYELQIQFVTELKQLGANTIQVIPVPSQNTAQLSGEWKLTPVREGTQVAFQATLVGQIPLPFLMKSMVTPLAQNEVKKLFERSLDNVRKAL